MASNMIEVRVTFSWWLKYLYIPMISIMCDITGMQPDAVKFKRVFAMGVKVEIIE